MLGAADPACDAEVLAETLLAGLSAELFVYLRDVREMPLERMKAGWAELVQRTIPAATGAGSF